MSGEDQDKTEQATAYKLEESRKKGTVSKSVDATTFVVMACFLAGILAFGAWLQQGIFRYASDFILLAGSMDSVGAGLSTLLGQAFQRGVFILSPLLAVAVLAGVIANIVQARPTFTSYPLKPDFSKLNPAQGLKRLFSGRTLFETLKSLLKLALISLVSWMTIKAVVSQSLALPTASVSRVIAVIEPTMTKLVYGLLFALFVIALIDFRYTVWEFAKKMRMSRRELKDEFKGREGDPLIRAKRREQQRAFRAKVGSIRKVSEADFVVTNPTHIAVALRYKRESMGAPKLLSKGAGDLATRIREEANRHGVPIIQSPALARLLYKKTEIDGFIPEEAYPGVAAVMFALYRRSKDT